MKKRRLFQPGNGAFVDVPAGAFCMLDPPPDDNGHKLRLRRTQTAPGHAIYQFIGEVDASGQIVGPRRSR